MSTPDAGSLASLRKEHGELLKRPHDQPDRAEAILAFLVKVQKAGAMLDAAPDREAAQGMLDYWTATFFTLPEGETLLSKLPTLTPEASAAGAHLQLAEYDPKTQREAVEAAEQWLAGLSENDRRLTRRIMLRLARLDTEGRSRAHFTSREAFNDLEPHDRAGEILDALSGLGMVRQAKGPSGEQQIGLRSEWLLFEWGTLRTWLQERRQFRKEATEWKKEGGAKRDEAGGVRRFVKRQLLSIGKRLDWLTAALLQLVGVEVPKAAQRTDELFEANYYRDRNQDELDYTYWNRLQEKEIAEWQRITRALVLVFIVCVVMLLVIWFIMQRVATRLATAAQEQKDQELRHKRQRVKELLAVVRLLAEYRRFNLSGSDLTDARAATARWRCENLIQSYLNDERDRDAYLADLKTIGIHIGDVRKVCVDCAEDSTTVAEKLGDLIAERSKDDRTETEKYAQHLKEINYTTMAKLVKAILDSYGSEALSEYVHEFWVLHWGEMRVVADGPVRQLMDAFAKRLEEIDRLAFDSVTEAYGLERDNKAPGSIDQATSWQKLPFYKPTKGGPLTNEQKRTALARQMSQDNAAIQKLRDDGERLIKALTEEADKIKQGRQ